MCLWLSVFDKKKLSLEEEQYENITHLTVLVLEVQDCRMCLFSKPAWIR